MSIRLAVAELATVLRTIPEFVTVYERPRDAISLGELPVGILALAPATPHRWGYASEGRGQHDYTIALYVLVGSRTSPINEIEDRLLDWPERIANALVANLTLNGEVLMLGTDQGEPPTLFTYITGVFPWAKDQEYWGARFLIPMTEIPAQPMGL